MDDDSGLLRAYFATTWTVHSPGGTLVLRLTDAVPPGSPLRPGGVVTAYNPASLLRAPEENREANRTLEAEIRSAGAAFWPAVAGGTGPDAARWMEPGFFLPGPVRPLLVELGVRSGQNAVVWVDPGGTPRLVVTRPGFCGREPGEEVRP
ncbi:MAG TPA: DUF3293 domain-containing protein [Longimicrobiaceae bacterium]|nr:DUF3293 domain-containing protein [Longimicrobiaceae bacterium]